MGPASEILLAGASALTERLLISENFCSGPYRSAQRATGAQHRRVFACGSRGLRRPVLPTRSAVVRRDALQHQPSRDELRARIVGDQASPAACGRQQLPDQAHGAPCSRGVQRRVAASGSAAVPKPRSESGERLAVHERRREGWMSFAGVLRWVCSRAALSYGVHRGSLL